MNAISVRNICNITPVYPTAGRHYIDALTPFFQKYPQSRPHIKRVVAEGDLVVLHVNSKKTPEDPGNAVVDIFHLNNNGKIVEHWDISMPVPESSASGRGMF
ncbi:nuclear transport factor 2 family protein [Neisseria arctica]|uniref:nuclear transport factor 2 family protein n=1 Tax=Neisseria arctica TaxID=1470200 RepID=UPI00191054A9|nr:nuclear transport factor 2 family protein [Neisseria arctica]UOO86254.1 nuclear transport factor 2 family protein [Neisseria arctica]